MNTWDKKVRVDKKAVPKRKVLSYYKKLWRESPLFRNTLKKKGAFIRAAYGNKMIIKRKGIKINNIDDLETAIRKHAVEFHITSDSINYKSYLDIDMPQKMIRDKKKITKSIIQKLRKKDINVSLVTDAPSGAHVFSNTSKSKLIDALKDITKEDDKFYLGRSSKTKIVLDPYEPNVAIPGSLSCKGKPYGKWSKI